MLYSFCCRSHSGNRREVYFVDSIVSFFVSVVAGIVTYYICKWLDSRKHASPNSAQTESVCAGSLGIQLAGDASYFGKTVKKPTIGDALRPVEPEDIRYANVLLYRMAFLGMAVCLSLLYFL